MELIVIICKQVNQTLGLLTAGFCAALLLRLIGLGFSSLDDFCGFDLLACLDRAPGSYIKDLPVRQSQVKIQKTGLWFWRRGQ